MKVTFEQGHEILARPGAVLLDVREECEFVVEHADGALLYPVDEIAADTVSDYLPDKSAPVVIYCRSGNRSAKAADILTALGYQEVYDMGALIGWPYGVVHGA